MILGPGSTIGFVGLGSMGGSIARNLLRGGVSLLVLDRDPERVASLVTEGAQQVADLGDFADASAVCVSLPGPVEVEGLCLGEAGLISRMRRGSALICLSTISLESCRKLDEAARSRGIAFVDAPVTGAADGARDASLVLMVGASPEAFALAVPIFDMIGQKAHLVGEAPAGTATKLLTNMLWFVHVIALCEALALGRATGVAPDVLGQVVRQSAGGSWVAEHDLDNLLAGDDDTVFHVGALLQGPSTDLRPRLRGRLRSPSWAGRSSLLRARPGQLRPGRRRTCGLTAYRAGRGCLDSSPVGRWTALK